MMGKLRNNENGFGAIEGLLIVAVVVLLGVVGYMVYKNHNKAANSSTTANTATKAPTKTTTTPAQPVDSYAGWKTYTLQYDKLTFKYPANWTIKASSNDNATDFVQFISPAGFNFSIQDGEGHLDGDGLPIITTEPISFTGQSDYIAYFGSFPGTANYNVNIASAAVVSDPTNQWSRPTDKNATRNDSFGGKNISILMSYGKTLTAQTVKDDPEYQNAKLVIKSMSY